MSQNRPNKKDLLWVWLRAGGRCQYPGCNEALWRDDLTMAKMNRAYLAHIVAEKPGGPRGDVVLSPKLAKDPSNFMLLCDTHHRLIDKEDVDGHPVDLLHSFRRAHEERIARLTNLQPEKKTHILMFASLVGYREGRVSFQQAAEAVQPLRYPATDTGMRLDLCEHEVDEYDAGFYAHMQKYVARRLKTCLARCEVPPDHLSVFALAPIPALIYLGKLLGDIRTTDAFQRHRFPESWNWREAPDSAADIEFLVERPETTDAKCVAVVLSLSNKIDPRTYRGVISGPYAEYQISIAHPRRDFVATREQRERFRTVWHELLSELRAHGRDASIHVFPAVPNSLAVEMGRVLLPKSDTPLKIYDDDREKGGFTFALEV